MKITLENIKESNLLKILVLFFLIISGNISYDFAKTKINGINHQNSSINLTTKDTYRIKDHLDNTDIHLTLKERLKIQEDKDKQDTRLLMIEKELVNLNKSIENLTKEIRRYNNNHLK